MKHAFLILLVVALLAAMTTPAVASQPDNYCTTVTVQATATGYNVNATGAGRYARVRDLTDAQTVIATDFGSGATSYTWTDLALDPTHNYQVQVSHTSLTSGYSTSGCLFTPPPPLAVVIASFAATCTSGGVLLEWETVSEIGVTSFTLSLHDAVLATIPAQHPGSPIGASYTYTDTASAGGVYTLTGAGDPATATVFCGPTAVSLTSFTAIRKPSCYVTGRWPTYACMCGRVAVPMWVCKAVKR